MHSMILIISLLLAGPCWACDDWDAEMQAQFEASIAAECERMLCKELDVGR